MEIVKTDKGLINIGSDKDELGQMSASRFVEIANEAIIQHGRCVVALSGGSTPKLLYRSLTSKNYEDSVDWNKVHFFVSDERCVPHEHKDSNWGMAVHDLLDKL